LHEFLKDREAIDVLEAFSSALGLASGVGGVPAAVVSSGAAGIPLEKLLENLRPLQPRYYSIASCPRTVQQPPTPQHTALILFVFDSFIDVM
jgi:sulfite reductase alpha subunit-like flavoprotein